MAIRRATLAMSIKLNIIKLTAKLLQGFPGTKNRTKTNLKAPY